MKLLGIAQKGTQYGLTRIRDIVQDTIEIDCHTEWHKSDWESGRVDFDAYDGILSQCVTHIPDEYRKKTVLFGLGSANRRIMGKTNIAQRIKDLPLAGFWVNNNTIRKAIKEATDLNPEVMYRPNEVIIPEDCPPKPKNRYILWYASEWNGCLKDFKKLSKDVIAALKDHKIRVFVAPHKEGWACDFSHSIALGKCAFNELMPTIHGMVRFGELGDFGRSTYDFTAHGKWVLGYDLDEPFTYAVHPDDDVETIVGKIVNLVDKEKEEERVDRWMYAKRHFSPQAVTKNWSEKLISTFS